MKTTMLRVRKLHSRDFKFLTAFVVLQLFDLLWTIASFEGELNPIALWLGREGFVLGKIIIIIAVSVIYILNLFPPRERKVLELVVIVLSLFPVIFIILQIITILA